MSDPAVTYLFSDVEGSTRLWETEPERIGPALARHDTIARDSVARHGGRVVKMTGDGLHAAFDDPLAAIAAVIEMQLGVAAPPDGMLPLAVRCGLHLGVDQRRDGDFFGPAVNRAARVMSAAHGGQVLLSQAVADRLDGRLPPELTLRDLGVVRLRDLTSPDRLYQLVHPRLRKDFPALRSLASTPNNLAQQLNSFIGREREVTEVKALLGQHRLVTLLAMGGIGKSRLSVQLGAEVLDDYPDGVWLVELAPLSDPGAVPQAVASVLGVKEEVGGTVTDALLRFVRDRRLLLILDNCEHLVEASADLVKRLLQAGPSVTVLATSRDALQLAGEFSYHLQTLSVPQAEAAATPDALRRHEAVRLFVDRATAAQPAFRLTPANATAVAAICQQLDGIPLALELAAARTRALPVDAIAARLGDRFRLLSTSDRTVLPRQRTLRALIDWSYDMLPPAERALFERLSVFAGGWTLEAAEAVGAGGEIDHRDVIDLLTRLVEKSLVTIDVETSRYRMLDTVRHYAAERLAHGIDERETLERHLHWFVSLAEKARPELAGPEQGRWLAKLDLERENLLTAHRYCDRAASGTEIGLQLAFLLKLYWFHRGLLTLSYRLLTEALARVPASDRGFGRCRGLCDLGQVCCYMGRHVEARKLLEESLRIAQELGDSARMAAALQPLSIACIGLNDLAAAHEFADKAVRAARQLGNLRQLAAALTSLGQLFRMEGGVDDAESLYAEALDIARSLGDEESVAIGLLNLSMLSIGRRDQERAAQLLDEAVKIVRATDSRSGAQSVLEVSAALSAAGGNADRAARLLGVAEAQALRSAIRRDRVDDDFLQPWIDAARDQLGEEPFRRARAAGASLTVAQGLDEAALAAQLSREKRDPPAHSML